MIGGEDNFGIDGLLGSTGVCGNSGFGFGDPAFLGAGTGPDDGFGVEVDLVWDGGGVGRGFG